MPSKNAKKSLNLEFLVIFYEFFTDDVVYNQALGPGGGATMDKRRMDIRDELGYIAPPNREFYLNFFTGNYLKISNYCLKVEKSTEILNFSLKSLKT